MSLKKCISKIFFWEILSFEQDIIQYSLVCFPDLPCQVKIIQSSVESEAF